MVDDRVVLIGMIVVSFLSVAMLAYVLLVR